MAGKAGMAGKARKEYHFGPRVYPRGSYVITHVHPWSVVRGPSLNISETALRIFLILDPGFTREGSYVITHVRGPSVRP